jgi:hypothetical protein
LITKYRIRTAFKNVKTVRRVITGLRPNNSEYKTKNAVYKLGCNYSCGWNFCGPKPTFVTMNEHKKLLSNDPKNSNLVVHCIIENHKIELGSRNYF